jgi:Protein of unknown function (DUF3830)
MADSVTAAVERTHVTRPTGVQIEFVSGEAARFEFLWDHAPDTCAVLSEALPAQGDAIHAIYSGTQLGVLFDPSIDAPLQNATTCHVPGDLIWMHYPEFSRFGHPEPVSEICWAYDRHTRMVMPGRFVQIAGSVFATFSGGADAWSEFAARSAQVRWDGKAQVRISMY